jgi:cupin 2 domain-containing protein
MTTTPSPPPALNICEGLPPPGAEETIATLLQGDGFRLQRIVSYGHASPAGFWYDQHEAEWIVVMKGRARLTIEGEPDDRELGPGDSLFIPAHCRHRVAWTQAGQPTVWLAIFADPRLSLEPAG